MKNFLEINHEKKNTWKKEITKVKKQKTLIILLKICQKFERKKTLHVIEKLLHALKK